jgi:hypothetical protein
VEDPTVPIDVALLDHEPPLVVSDNVIVELVHTLSPPDIAPIVVTDNSIPEVEELAEYAVQVKVQR